MKEEEPHITDKMDTEDDGGLVFSAISEFASNLSTLANFNEPSDRASSRRRKSSAESDSDEDEDADRNTGRRHQSKEEDDDDNERDGDDDDDDAGRSKWMHSDEEMGDSTEIKSEREENEGDNVATGPIEEEPLVSGGMAATLALLKQKNLVEKVTDEQLDKEKRQIEKSKWMAEQRLKDKLREMQKEKEKARSREINKAKGGRGGGRQDEWQQEEDNRALERARARELEEKFKNYTPAVDLKYKDEHGRALNQKEVSL
jgi:U4/U6.U5 tri-snRNP-associated protein 1